MLCLTCLFLALVAHVVTLLVAGDDYPRWAGWIVFAAIVGAVAALLFPVADALWRIHLPRWRAGRNA